MYVLLFRILKTNELATMIFFSKEIGFNSKGTKKHLLRPEATGTNEIFSRYRILTKYEFTMVKPNRQGN